MSSATTATSASSRAWGSGRVRPRHVLGEHLTRTPQSDRARLPLPLPRARVIQRLPVSEKEFAMRTALRTFVMCTVTIAAIIAPNATAFAQDDPLPSWNDGAVKKSIVQFVEDTTNKSSPKYVIPEERVATFDQDGTLWVSHPIYAQVAYCLDRVPTLVKAKPELAKEEPFKTVISGNKAAIAKLPMPELRRFSRRRSPG